MTAQEDKPDNRPDDGGFQAMDQIANWVRFADAKATILTAGIGVVLTMLMWKIDSIIEALNQGFPAACVVGFISLITSAAFVYTLCWMVRAIGPQSGVNYDGLNRFAWPTLTKAKPDDLVNHAKSKNVRADVWRQVSDLSVLAEQKFRACERAVKGYMVFVVLGVMLVAVAAGFTA